MEQCTNSNVILQQLQQQERQNSLPNKKKIGRLTWSEIEKSIILATHNAPELKKKK